MKKLSKNNKGFSLVELIVVVLIMAIIAVALAPQVLRWVNNSRIASDFQLAGQMVTAAETALTDESAFAWAKAGSDKTYICNHGDGLKDSASTPVTFTQGSKPTTRSSSNGETWFKYRFLEAMGEANSANIKTKTDDVTIELKIKTTGKVEYTVKKGGSAISSPDQD